MAAPSAAARPDANPSHDLNPGIAPPYCSQRGCVSIEAAPVQGFVYHNINPITYTLPSHYSQAPRLHAILARRQTSPLPVLSPDAAAVAAALPALRLTALELLGTALGGDLLAAEYLLLQLVSRCACTFYLEILRVVFSLTKSVRLPKLVHLSQSFSKF